MSAAARTAARSLLATVEITVLASVAHVLAGGRLPAPGFLLAFALVVFAGALLTLGRVVRLAAVVPLVMLSQVGLHASLDGVPAHPGMGHGAEGSVLTLTGPMLWAHLVTAVVTAIVLLGQERVVALLVAVVRIGTDLAPTPARRLRPRTAPLSGPARQVLLSTSPRRGPPFGLCATS